ncbi:MAG: hypothetical protein LAO78_23450 [Acidobacteriia bacterium]|nr:hypothetical protein [Terriglobia bacterium]
MADRKTTRSNKQPSSYRRFPEVKGKVVSLVEVDHNAQAILIMFEDNTVLGFDIDSSHVVFPQLSDRKKGNWKSIKQWPPIHSPISMVKWP